MLAVTVGFEDIGGGLPLESAFNGPDPDGVTQAGEYEDTVVVGKFESGGLELNNIYSLDFGNWTGWAYSNKTDVLTPGFRNQFSAYTGEGAGGSATYAVAYRDVFDYYPLPTIERTAAMAAGRFRSVAITNTTYAALSMLHGDSFAKKFGGATGSDPDWFLLTIEGRDTGGNSLGTVDFYLADYRSGDNSQDYIVDQWTTVDISSLETAASLEFKVTSSDVGLYKMNTPAFFALDNLELAVPDNTFVVSQFEITPSGFAARFNRELDSSALNLYDVQSAVFGPADVTLVGNQHGPIPGSLVVGPDRVTFVATGGPLPADSYTLTLRSAADAFKDLASGELLNGNDDGQPGGDYVRHFSVTAPEPAILSLPDFTRGPGQTAIVPASDQVAGGLPLTISEAGGVTSVDVTLVYDPALLTISGAAPGPTAPAGTTVGVETSEPGRVIFRLRSPQPFEGEAAELITVAAAVPCAAPYGAVHVLDLTDVAVNGGAIPVTTDDAIHVAALFGDTTGNGQYSGLDAQRTARVALGLDTGFQAFPLIDPVVIADITANGQLSGLDAQRIGRVAAGLDAAEIPPPATCQPLADTAPRQLADAAPGSRSRSTRAPLDRPATGLLPVPAADMVANRDAVTRVAEGAIITSADCRLSLRERALFRGAKDDVVFASSLGEGAAPAAAGEEVADFNTKFDQPPVAPELADELFARLAGLRPRENLFS